MRSNANVSCVTLAAIAVLMSACSSASAPSTSGSGATTSQPPTPFTDNTGEGAAATPAAYPAGPYGFEAGTIIPDFEFYGFHNAMASTSAMTPIYLHDFYNPHAHDTSYMPAAGEQDDRYFPMTSGYAKAGKLKPTVLLVDIASVWCGPCNNEAQTLLPFKHSMYAPCGGEFLLDLHDSNTPGTTATQTNLKNWTKIYKVDYPAAIDPAYKLDAYFAADAFPNNMIIDTTTMKIVHVVAGEVIPGICSDMATVCGTSADLATCSGTGGFNCGGLAACPSGACTQYDFWTKYESLLDKTRTGCTVQ